MKDPENLICFLNALGKRIKENKTDIANNMSDVLLGPLKIQKDKPPISPTCSFDPKLLLPHESNLINLLKDCINLLSWREAGFGKLPESISKQICVTELIGPNGFFEHSNIRIGLLLQRPETNYPWHHHAAEELYFVLSGKAYWAVDQKEPRLNSTESFIHHKSDQSHCMITRNNHMLAVWGWTGDINGSTYSI
jgi:dimethylpropiothetin dethiomethylase